MTWVSPRGRLLPDNVDPNTVGATGGGGQGTLVFSSTLASAGQFSVTNIPQTGADLLAVFMVQSAASGATDTLDVGFNTDFGSGSNYNSTHTVTTNTATGPVIKPAWDYLIANPTIPAQAIGSPGMFGLCRMYVPNYTGSQVKVASFQETIAFGTTSGTVNDATGTGFWNSTAAINAIKAIAGSTPFNFAAGSSLRVYVLD